MQKSIVAQYKMLINKGGFQFVFTINFLYVIVTYLYYVISQWGQELSTVTSPSAVMPLMNNTPFSDIYFNLLPFLVIFPYAFTYLTDKLNHMLPLLQIREGVKKYYISRTIVCFGANVFCFSAPFLAGVFLNYITFPQSGITFIGDMYDINFDAEILGSNVLLQTDWKGIWFPGLFLKSPFLYCLLYIMLFSFCMGILGVFAFACSFFVKRKIVLFLSVFSVISLFNILDEFSYFSGSYTCFKMLLYVTVNSHYGKNPWCMLAFYGGIFVAAMLVIVFQQRKDQIE